jgi:ribosomal protein L9
MFYDPYEDFHIGDPELPPRPPEYVPPLSGYKPAPVKSNATVKVNEPKRVKTQAEYDRLLKLAQQASEQAIRLINQMRAEKAAKQAAQKKQQKPPKKNTYTNNNKPPKKDNNDMLLYGAVGLGFIFLLMQKKKGKKNK